MNPAFADASYWIALIFPRDAHHAMALELAQLFVDQRRTVVTSQMVLAEFLTFFASFGPYWREVAIQFLEEIIADPNTVVLEQSGALFMRSVELYSQRPDKEWGITDCASFVIMMEHGLHDALTHDKHFEQAGFVALMRRP